MNRIFTYISLLFIVISCLNLENENPYNENTHEMTINLSFPDDINEKKSSGIEIELYNINTRMVSKTSTGENGIAKITLVNGMYRVSAKTIIDNILFNASEDKVKIAGKDKELTLNLLEVRPGELLIKEMYFGGCMVYDKNSDKPDKKEEYQIDKYFVLHNNTEKVYYLDSLCIGTIDPYNSNSAHNVWLEKDKNGNIVYPSFLPVIQAIWRIPGDGKSFPLQPGEDAFIVTHAAIDHTAKYLESVNLDRKGFFVCYNPKFFDNVLYHPVPGPNIEKNRYMDLVIKTGKANAYAFSVNSPTFIIFKAKGQSMENFLSKPGNVIQKPGSDSDKISCIPPEWVIDGVEVFNGLASENTKRLLPSIDASAIVLSSAFKGYALKRKINKKASEEKNYEVLMDTNDSKEDFYEVEHASLWTGMEDEK